MLSVQTLQIRTGHEPRLTRPLAKLAKPCLAYIKSGPSTPTPDYTNIDAQPLNRLFMRQFRRKMVETMCEDVPTTGYQGLVELAHRLNTMYGSSQITQARTGVIVKSLFPSWLTEAFKMLFPRYFPALACQINALVTVFTCQWLMGVCTVNNAEVDGGKIGFRNGVKVERCRFLEATGCASVCVNTCKVPTQDFFKQHMGLALTMTPNYEDFSCQFTYGKTPLPQALDPAFSTPCLGQCPAKKWGAETAKVARASHSQKQAAAGAVMQNEALSKDAATQSSLCHQIETEGSSSNSG